MSREIDLHKFDLFDLEAHLVRALDLIAAEPLVPGVGASATGIYALYHNGRLVYVGKAWRTNSVRARLGEHFRKIAGRRNISVSEMTCKYLTIDKNWLVVAAEDALITYYNPRWNRTGFGSHVPGAGRPGVKGPGEWDRLYPPKE